MPVPALTTTPDRADPAGGGPIRGQKPQNQLIRPQNWAVAAKGGHGVDRVIQRKFLSFLKSSLPNGNAKRVAILLASVLQ